MGSLTKEQLQEAAAVSNLPKEKVDCPELGPVLKCRPEDAYLWVRGLSGRERDEWERSNIRQKRGRVETNWDAIGNSRARLAVKCLINEDGTKLLDDSDVGWLGNLRSDTLSRIYATAQRLSNVTDEDLDELKKLSESQVGSGSSSN